MRKKILLALTISLCATSFLKAEIFNLTSNGFHNFKTNNIEYIIEVPGVSQEELFKSAKLYVTSIYDSYSKIATDIENEVIIINSSDDNKISAKNHAR